MHEIEINTKAKIKYILRRVVQTIRPVGLGLDVGQSQFLEQIVASLGVHVGGGLQIEHRCVFWIGVEFAADCNCLGHLLLLLWEIIGHRCYITSGVRRLGFYVPQQRRQHFVPDFIQIILFRLGFHVQFLGGQLKGIIHNGKEAENMLLFCG